MKYKGIGMTFILLLAGCSMNLPKNKIDLIEMKSNVVINEMNLSAILDKLNDLENKSNLDTVPLCILHIGDSHVQMGHFSNTIRKGLQEEFGGSELGVFFPYILCGGYNPAGMALSSTSPWKCATNSKPDSTIQVGITGATAQTIDSITQIEFAFKGLERIKTVTLYHQKLNNDFEIRCEGAQITTIDTNNQTAFTSITLPGEATSIKVEIVKIHSGKHQFSLFGVSMNQLKSTGIDYHTFGVSGNQYKFYETLSPLFEEQLKDLKPDLLIISLGSNDAYRKDIDSIQYQNLIVNFVESLRKISPKTSFIITFPPDTKYKNERPDSEKTVLNSIRFAANKTQISAWDFHTLMGGFESNPKWQKIDLANKDGLHLTNDGYQIEGALFNLALAKALKNKYPTSSWLEKTENSYRNQVLKYKLF